jgi:hypothetical protein
MPVQARRNIDNAAFLLSGDLLVREAETIAQDAGRAIPLAPKTVMAKTPGANTWVALDEINPAEAPAFLTCGARGSTLEQFQAVVDGEFSVDVDGVTIELAGLDFSDIDAPGDTSATLTCGANGGIIGAYTAVNNAAFNITVGGVASDVGPVDLTGCTTFADVKDALDAACAVFGVRCLYDETADTFSFVSVKTGRLATLAGLAAPAAGTDIHGAGFLNGAAAVAVDGTGGIGATIESVINAAAAGRFRVEYDAANDLDIFISPKTGQASTMTLLATVAVPAGTDISGAGANTFLNGDVAPAAVTPATGFSQANIPTGIYIGDEILAATIVAGNVTNCPIIVGGTATINSDQIVLEGGLALTDIIVHEHKTIREVLTDKGMAPESVILIAGYET